MNKALFGALCFAIVGTVSIFTPPILGVTYATNFHTCPEGNGWTKIDWSDHRDDATYSASAGKFIDEVCVKGGQTKRFYTSDGTQGCWKVDFKNSGAQVKVEEVGHHCSPDISHVSYHQSNIVTPTPTPTATPTPTPTPVVTPTPTPVVTPTPTPVATATPNPTSTPVPQPGKESKMALTSLSCKGGNTEAIAELFMDGKPVENVNVKFIYENEAKFAKTNKDGRASVAYGWKADARVYMEPEDGFPAQSQELKAPTNECAVTTGQVLGASTLAEAGFIDDAIMSVVGFVGTSLSFIGSILYAKKR